MYLKTRPNISCKEFLEAVKPVKTFLSLTGREYEVIRIDGSMLQFVRKSSGQKWSMDLTGVHRAYVDLADFKTANFRPYVSRVHSPALGLLLHLKLLVK